MIAIICKKCKKEFRVSGAELNERHLNKVQDLCNACMEIKSKKRTIVDKKDSVAKKSIKSKGK